MTFNLKSLVLLFAYRFTVGAVVLISAVLGSAYTYANELTLSVDRTEIEIGDTVRLRYAYNGDAKQQVPDFNAIKDHFSILSYFPSVSQRIENGDYSINTTWELVVEPKQKGKILIPPISFQGKTTDPVEITVSEASQNNIGNKDFLLETFVDKSSAYVQEQLIVTYRLYFATQIEVEPGDLQINDAIVTPQESTQYQRRIDGKLYRVVELPYTIFPQRSGTLVIPQTTWKIRIAVGGQRRSLFDTFGRYETKTLKSDEKVLRIKSIPDAFPANASWLPASTLSAKGTWSQDPNKLIPGEPVTRSITLSGKGIESAQLPAILDDTSNTNLKVYLEPAQFSDKVDAQGLSGSRTETGAYVLSSDTPSITPEIRIPWWNTTEDKLDYVVIPEKQLSVDVNWQATQTTIPTVTTTPNNVTATSDIEQADSSSTNINNTDAGNINEALVPNWLVVVLCFGNALLLISTVASLFYARALRRKLQRDDANQTSSSFDSSSTQKDISTKTIKRAIDQNQYDQLFELLTSLAIRQLKLNNFSELKALARQQNERKLEQQLAQIESLAYSRVHGASEVTVNADDLTKQLNRLWKVHIGSGKNNHRKKNTLAQF